MKSLIHAVGSVCVARSILPGLARIFLLAFVPVAFSALAPHGTCGEGPGGVSATPQETLKFSEVKRLAEAGSAQAQASLAQMYETGKGVDRSDEEAFKWWLKAANQGLRVGEHNVGVAYLSGIGVKRDRDEALKWFTKAAAQGDSQAEQYAQRISSGQSAARPVYVTVQGQRTPAAKQGEDATVYTLKYASQSDYDEGTPGSETVKIVSAIVSDYHKTHTYIGGDIFVCADMASDVWNMLQAKSINAKIQIGDVNSDIKSILESNHAWVMAEVLPGKWLALETTGGYVVFPDKNQRYYRGHAFSNPKELKEYSELLHQLRAAELKDHQAREDYNELVGQYNRADAYTQRGLVSELNRRAGTVDQRTADVNEIVRKLKALLGG